MIKLITTMTIICAFNLNAQISKSSNTLEIGKNKRGGITSSEIYITIPDSTYHLMFRDEKYINVNSYRTISFKATKADVDYLFKSLDSACNSKYSKNFNIKLNIGTHLLEITQTKFLSMTYAQIYSDIGSFTLTRKELLRLFDK